MIPKKIKEVKKITVEKLTIGKTTNLGDYESLRIDIEVAPFPDEDYESLVNRATDLLLASIHKARVKIMT